MIPKLIKPIVFILVLMAMQGFCIALVSAVALVKH
jgi:hypothetical protein